jgi:glutamine synthetase
MNIEDTLKRMAESDIQQVRLAWCDMHGDLRGKTVMPLAVEDALRSGIGLVGTLALKDTSDRTAFKVFEAGGTTAFPELANAANLVLRPHGVSYQELPWAPGTAWLQGQVVHTNGSPVALDTRHILQTALAKLEAQGLGMRCGLEVEFHIYKIENTRPQLDPDLAAWPGLPPAVSMIHPGYRLLSEQWMDMADEPLRIVRDTAQALGLPLTSLEIELGPSQVEAVFEATDALTAADNMVLFRSAVKQALQRAGYHATFMCRPPFPHIMSSGWHLHQSLVQLGDDSNAFDSNAFAKPAPAEPAQDWYQRAMAAPPSAPRLAKPLAASSYLSPLGTHYLAGLLAHAPACTALSNPSINARHHRAGQPSRHPHRKPRGRAAGQPLPVRRIANLRRPGRHSAQASATTRYRNAVQCQRLAFAHLAGRCLAGVANRRCVVQCFWQCVCGLFCAGQAARNRPL